MSELTSVLTDAPTLRNKIHQKVTGALTSVFPLDLKGRTLEVKDVKVHDRTYSSEEQKKALLSGGSLQNAVKGTLVLKGADGRVIDEAKDFTLAHVPYMTDRHTIVADGNEYQFANQIRRKPGVYTQRSENGELHTAFNLGKGKNFDIGFNPSKGTFHLQYGTSNIPLYGALRGMGVTHDEIAKHLGEGVARENEKEHGKHAEAAIRKLYQKLEHPALYDPKLPHAGMVDVVKKRYGMTTLDPEVTEHTLGKPHATVTHVAMLDAAKKLLAVHNGKTAVDDTDSLAFKTFHAADDFLAERIKLTARAWAPKARLAMTGKQKIREGIRPAPFSDSIRKFVTTSSLTAVPSGINPLELLDHAVKVTSLGEGGIGSDRAIPLDARMTHATHFGALDPIRTPESGHAGVDIRATIAAHRDDRGNLYSTVKEIKTGKQVFIKAGDLTKHIVAFPGQNLKGSVQAFVNGVVQSVPGSRVTHEMMHVSHQYSPATSLIPMIHNIQGNRAIMGSKMGTQALPLLEREVPFVQVKSHLPGEVSFESIYGHMTVPTAPVSGTVEKIENGYVYIRPHGEKRATEEAPPSFPDEIMFGARHHGKGDYFSTRDHRRDYQRPAQYAGKEEVMPSWGEHQMNTPNVRAWGHNVTPEYMERHAGHPTTILTHYDPPLAAVGHDPVGGPFIRYHVPTSRKDHAGTVINLSGVLFHPELGELQELEQRIKTNPAAFATQLDTHLAGLAPQGHPHPYGAGASNLTRHEHVKMLGLSPRHYQDDLHYTAPPAPARGTVHAPAQAAVHAPAQTTVHATPRSSFPYAKALGGLAAAGALGALAYGVYRATRPASEKEPVQKVAEDRPVIEQKKLGPHTFNIEIKKGVGHKAEGQTKAKGSTEDYGHLPGYTGPDGDSLDFFVGNRPDGLIYAYDKQKRVNAKGDLDLKAPWKTTDVKFIVGHSPEEAKAFHRNTEEFNSPTVRFVNRRFFKDWDHLQRHIDEHHKNEKTAAKDDLPDFPPEMWFDARHKGTGDTHNTRDRDVDYSRTSPWRRPGAQIDHGAFYGPEGLLPGADTAPAYVLGVGFGESRGAHVHVGEHPIGGPFIHYRVPTNRKDFAERQIRHEGVLFHHDSSALEALKARILQDPAAYSDHMDKYILSHAPGDNLWSDPKYPNYVKHQPFLNGLENMTREHHVEMHGLPAKTYLPDHVAYAPAHVAAHGSVPPSARGRHNGLKALGGVVAAAALLYGGKKLWDHYQQGPEDRGAAKVAAAKDDHGLIKVPFETNFPFPSKTYLHHELSVKPGQKVNAGDRLGDSNFTRNGTLALGKNLLVGYMPYHGLNSNDAVVISEGCAQKLTSEHMYREIYPLSSQIELSKGKHKTFYGNKYTPQQYEKLDDSGVIRKGTRVDPKDPLVLGLTKAQIQGVDLMLGRISKSLTKPYREVTLQWEHGTPGEVVEVLRSPNQIAILVKTHERMNVGDKLAGRYGNKGVVAKIVPDHEMIQDEKGRPLDLILTSAGVVSRINPAQIIETAVGKVVEKTRRPILYDNAEEKNAVKWAKDLLKQHNIKDKEHVYDPRTQRTIKGPDGKGVLVGRQFIYKLFKSTDTNFSGHGVGPYDVNEQPLKTGGDESAKGIGKMEFDAIVAHNARSFLQEASSIKSQKNDEFWRAVQLGSPLPTPKPSFAFNKFTAMLEGSGVKVDKRGSKFKLLPMTDKDVLERSRGAIENKKTLIAKNLKPETGGLFDPNKTGGPQGTLYSHIDLHEAVPHPVFVEPIRRVLGLSQKDFDQKLHDHGGKWFHTELGKIDSKKRIEELRAQMVKAKGPELDNIVKQIKYLTALDKENIKPQDAYLISKIPVIPPVFRPILPEKRDPSQLMVADANKLYAHLMDTNDVLRTTALPSDLGKHRNLVFKAVGAVFGVNDPEDEKLQKQEVKGFLQNIAGVGTPKGGFFQRKLMRRTQDMSGRGTAVPDGNLGMDEVGIPEQMLWQMYDKMIVARLVRQGYSALMAREMVDKKQPVARQALEAETRERPVLINRAPTLHRWSVVAAYPKMVQGKTIRVNPFVEKGMNLDYDGDTLQVHAPIQHGAVEDAKKMTLSQMLLSDQQRNKLMAFPQHEAIIGFTLASKATTPTGPAQHFRTREDAMAAWRSGKLKLTDAIVIDQEKKASYEEAWEPGEACDLSGEEVLSYWPAENVTGYEADTR